MKLLFVTPPMGNWVRWGSKHITVNPFHAQLAAYVREKKVADVFGAPSDPVTHRGGGCRASN